MILASGLPFHNETKSSLNFMAGFHIWVGIASYPDSHNYLHAQYLSFWVSCQAQGGACSAPTTFSPEDFEPYFLRITVDSFTNSVTRSCVFFCNEYHFVCKQAAFQALYYLHTILLLSSYFAPHFWICMWRFPWNKYHVVSHFCRFIFLLAHPIWRFFMRSYQ